MTVQVFKSSTLTTHLIEQGNTNRIRGKKIKTIYGQKPESLNKSALHYVLYIHISASTIHTKETDTINY